jgi:hypothetical protein
MENHPIPQDVTGFKFKLIGSITVKQFLYLLGFGILATVSYVIFQTNIFLMIPSVAFFAAIGASLAFLPIEGRPMDVMLMNFIKTIPSENRYIYRKHGVNLSNFEYLDRTMKQQTPVVQNPQTQTASDAARAEDKRALLISTLRNSNFRPDETETKTLNNIKTFFEDSGTDSKKSRINQAKLAEVYAGNISSQSATGTVQTTTIVSKKQAVPIEDTTGKAEVKEPETTVPAQKPAIQASVKNAPPATDTPKPPELKLSSTDETNKEPGIEIPKADVAWQQTGNLPAGFPSLPDVANVVLGMVRDSRNKTLPNILVEVVDSGGVPVRAFKTNALGQFASATPLPNGVYKIYFDDPQKQHEITPIDIELKGEIFQPVEAVSVDDRERLRRELFGGAAPNT